MRRDFLADEIERLRIWQGILIFFSVVCLSFVLLGALWYNYLLVVFAVAVSLIPLLSLVNISIRPDGTSQQRWLKSEFEKELDNGPD